jgi:serine phosphatase RsbU (regulator of sigma subunit)/PAS domain-containing protein
MARSADTRRNGSEDPGLKARVEALRQAAALRGTRLRPLLEAALAELDGAVEKLADAGDPAARDTAADAGPHGERRLLQAVFQQVPVPLFLLGLDGIVRRANSAAGQLVGSGSGYPTGKPFTAFVDLPFRAAVASQLAAVIRTGQTRGLRCGLLTPDGVSERTVTASPLQARGDAGQIVVAVTGPGALASGGIPDLDGDAEQSARPAAGAGTPPPAADSVLRQSIRRLDLVTAATRILLEIGSHGESVTLQRFARLLARELGAWAILDLERQQRLRRRLVVGSEEDQRSEELARLVAAADPPPGSAPRQVHQSRSSLLVAHADDPGILGDGQDGEPLLLQLGVTSVLCVPLSDAQRSYGALTLARTGAQGPFGMADVGLVEELAEQLALAIQMNRQLQHRAAIAEALQVSLLPRLPRQIPGMEVAVAHLPAATAQEAGGDFCGVYPAAGGWGFSIGDACGRGPDVAALTASARHAIRVLAHWDSDPVAVLRRANEILLEEDQTGSRFVTAIAGHLRRTDNGLHVVLGSAGHPWPVLVRPDGRAQALQGGGLPLGIFPQADPVARELDLEPGDLLFAYSDGMTSTYGPDMEYFEDRLAGELAALSGQPADRVVSRIREVLMEFSGGQLRDDVTMLALRAGDSADGLGPVSLSSLTRRSRR